MCLVWSVGGFSFSPQKPGSLAVLKKRLKSVKNHWFRPMNTFLLWHEILQPYSKLFIKNVQYLLKQFNNFPIFAKTIWLNTRKLWANTWQNCSVSIVRNLPSWNLFPIPYYGNPSGHILEQRVSSYFPFLYLYGYVEDF